jgi:rhodanese-related sulfurtransferase
METKAAEAAGAEGSREGRFSFVNEYPPAEPELARAHFLMRLSVETDPADVQLDLERAPHRIQVVDARSAEAYGECHVPGAINLPHRSIDARSTAALERDRTLVVYCWGPGCNAAQKGAARLAALGFRVKEMIGGLEYWRCEGHAVEGSAGAAAPLYG